jgi:hypothetical protein
MNCNWRNRGYPEQNEKDVSLGGYNALNLYYMSDWKPKEFNGQKLGNNTLLGSCSFPTDILTPDVIRLDGCIMQQKTLPGNTVNPETNFGLTTVHEVGHWLGLEHPWGTGGLDPGFCTEPNHVADLPQMWGPSEGCDNNFKSCPLQPYPFVDPIHNYMGYADDCCLYEFTPGQIVTMLAVFTDMRLNK